MNPVRPSQAGINNYGTLSQPGQPSQALNNQSSNSGNQSENSNNPINYPTNPISGVPEVTVGRSYSYMDLIVLVCLRYIGGQALESLSFKVINKLNSFYLIFFFVKIIVFI
jgi:hypothetical protein